MGREPLICEEIIASICADLAEGFTLAVAYGNVGITKATFFVWYEKGCDPESDPIYIDFKDRVDKAKAEGRKKLERRVVNAKDPKVALTVLSRLYRDDWGEKVSVDVDGTMNHNVTFAAKEDIEKL